MKYSFSLLWIAFFSWTSIIYGEECPANKAIYTSSDGSKTFETTHFAIKQSLGCYYYLFDDENAGATFGFKLPPEGYYDTVKPDYYDLDRKDERGSLMCSQNKYIMLRGKVNDEVVYLWDETIKAAPCCVEYSLSENSFKERLEKINFSSHIIWLQDELVPMAKTEIDTITNNDYYSDFEQPLGEDIYALTGCRQNETLYGDKYLKAAKIKALKYASENKEQKSVTMKDSDGEMSNGMKVGHWKYYDNAGKLWSEGSYKNGKKDGLWTIYDTDGSISETATWVNGELE